MTIHERRVIAKQMIYSGITSKKAANILEIPVSTLYYHTVKAEQDKALSDMIKEIAFKHTFYGYRRIHFTINRRGIHVNHKRIYLIYKSLSLQRQKPRKNKKRIVLQMPLTEALFCNHVWPVDFLFDALTDHGIFC